MASHPPAPVPEQLYQRPGFLLRRAHQLSVGLFDLHCRELNLTPPQYGVLHLLSYAQEIDQGTLSKALGYDKVTTLHIVRGLQSRGLLERVASTAGRRRMLIHITAPGRALLQQAGPGAAKAFEQLLHPLTPTERTQLLDLLERLCDGLEHGARSPMVKLLPPPARKSPRNLDVPEENRRKP